MIMNSGSVGGMVVSPADSKVETISRLCQWRIDNFGPCAYRRSDPFKMGIWNWFFSVEKNRHMYVRLFPDCRVAKEQPPLAKFVVRVSSSGPGRRSLVSAVHDKMLRTSEDFVWAIDPPFHGRFVIDVEFLDLKIASLTWYSGLRFRYTGNWYWSFELGNKRPAILDQRIVMAVVLLVVCTISWGCFLRSVPNKWHMSHG